HGTAGFDSIHALIPEVRKEDCVFMETVRSATILVHACTHIETCGNGIGGRAVCTRTNNGHAAAFFRPAFEPIKVSVRKTQFAETDTGRRKKRASNRRFPRTKRRDCGHHYL